MTERSSRRSFRSPQVDSELHYISGIRKALFSRTDLPPDLIHLINRCRLGTQYGTGGIDSAIDSERREQTFRSS